MKFIVDKPEENIKISKKTYDRTMGDSINRQATIDALKIDCSWDIFDEYGNITERGQDIIEAICRVPPAESVKAYTKADYIMALHKEYGCTLTMAEEAHNKALEYLRSKARMKG